MRSQPLDRISTLPENIIEHILTLMPIRDALRTSVLSKKWRYTWRSMPKLEFTKDMVEPDCGSGQLKKYKLTSAIFHILLLHSGPTVLKFNCSVDPLDMDSEFGQMISNLATGNKVKKLIIVNDNIDYKLPISFFSLQGLEHIDLVNCTFEPPLTFNRFSCLKSITFTHVKVSSQMLKRFLLNCPLLERISLNGYPEVIAGFAAAEHNFTFVDFLQCVPLIRFVNVLGYMQYFCAGGMPHKLPTSLVHLKYLSLTVCMEVQNEISAALCLIRSSPSLVKVRLLLYDDDELPVRQTPTNFLNPKDYSDLRLDHLKTLDIRMFSDLPLEMEFVKLIMAKSPVLKKLTIVLGNNVSINEEVKMLRDLVLLPFPRASPSAKLIIKRL